AGAAVPGTVTSARAADRAAETREVAAAVEVSHEGCHRKGAPRRDRDRLAGGIESRTAELVPGGGRGHPLPEAGRAAARADPDPAGNVPRAVVPAPDLERAQAAAAPGETEGHHRVPDVVLACALVMELADGIRGALGAVAAAALAEGRRDDRGTAAARGDGG